MGIKIKPRKKKIMKTNILKFILFIIILIVAFNFVAKIVFSLAPILVVVAMIIFGSWIILKKD